MAPEFLSEAAFDAVLASSLVGVTNRLEREGWIEGAVRKTIIPFGVVCAMTMVLACGDKNLPGGQHRASSIVVRGIRL